MRTRIYRCPRRCKFLKNLLVGAGGRRGRQEDPPYDWDLSLLAVPVPVPESPAVGARATAVLYAWFVPVCRERLVAAGGRAGGSDVLVLH